ncbi:MAG: phosphagen kinase [Rhizobiaceae bacterium]
MSTPTEALNSQLEKIASLKATQPNNIAVQCFDRDYFETLDAPLQQRLLDCMRSGIENPDSEMGCYAREADDYKLLRPFFSCAIGRHHGIAPDARHVSDWSIPAAAGGEGGGERMAGDPLDITKFGLGPLSLRIRVGRNFSDLPLTSAMSRDDRLALEDRMSAVFDQLQEVETLAGTYHSLTPGHPRQLSPEQYQQLVAEHVMFKDMGADSYLASAGISADWPHGRGCYATADRSFIVWIGEEDHLRIMCMKTGTELKSVLDLLHNALQAIESRLTSEFAMSDRYGAITTCPTNLGTGMRASIHLKLPHLTADGSTERVKEIAKPLGLAIRGLGGEHTPVGTDGTVDVSPRARLCITEGEIVARLYDGIGTLLKAEAAAAVAAG